MFLKLRECTKGLGEGKRKSDESKKKYCSQVGGVLKNIDDSPIGCLFPHKSIDGCSSPSMYCSL
jgi:hypothetical protein